MAVMEVTPYLPDSLIIGTVIKQITVSHMLYKQSSKKGRGIQTLFWRNNLLFTENHKFTNFIIGGLLAGLHRSPLT